MLECVCMCLCVITRLCVICVCCVYVCMCICICVCVRVCPKKKRNRSENVTIVGASETIACESPFFIIGGDSRGPNRVSPAAALSLSLCLSLSVSLLSISHHFPPPWCSRHKRKYMYVQQDGASPTMISRLLWEARNRPFKWA